MGYRPGQLPKHRKGTVYNWNTARKINSPARKFIKGKKAFFSMKYKRKFDNYGQFAQINRE